jgi:DNA-binding NarL/FixJ family response regulator
VLPPGSLPVLAEPPPAELTDREREVYQLVRRGLRDKQIAEELVISVKTVEKHVGAMLRKTGARNRTELVGREIPTR